MRTLFNHPSELPTLNSLNLFVSRQTPHCRRPGLNDALGRVPWAGDMAHAERDFPLSVNMGRVSHSHLFSILEALARNRCANDERGGAFPVPSLLDVLRVSELALAMGPTPKLCRMGRLNMW